MKVSKCCKAEFYDQAENNYGGGYAPNEVCSNCEKRAESTEDISKGMKELIQQKRLIDDDINIPN